MVYYDSEIGRMRLYDIEKDVFKDLYGAPFDYNMLIFACVGLVAFIFALLFIAKLYRATLVFLQR